MAYDRASKGRPCKHCQSPNLVWKRDAESSFKWRLRNSDGTIHTCLSGPPQERDPEGPAPDFPQHPDRPAPDFEQFDRPEGRPDTEAPKPENDEPAPAPRTGLDAAIAAIVDATIAPQLRKIRSDVKTLIEQAPKEEKERKPRVITVVVKRPDDTEYKVEGAHAQFADLLRLCEPIPVLGRIPVLLYGKPGASKSHSGKQLAEALGLSFWSISLTPQTPESRLFGLVPLPGQEAPRTGFMDAVEHGGVVLIDELDFGPAALLGALNSLLANRFASFPGTGRVPVHPDFVMIATANTPGRGGSVGHETRRPLDAATLDRFAIIEWRYDVAQEASLTAAINPEAAGWAEWVGRMRKEAETVCPQLTVSPRASYFGAGLLAKGFKPAAVADMILFRGLDPAIVAKLLSICPLPEAK